MTGSTVECGRPGPRCSHEATMSCFRACLGHPQAMFLGRASQLWLYITGQLVSPWLPPHHAHHCFPDSCTGGLLFLGDPPHHLDLQTTVLAAALIPPAHRSDQAFATFWSLFPRSRLAHPWLPSYLSSLLYQPRFVEVKAILTSTAKGRHGEESSGPQTLWIVVARLVLRAHTTITERTLVFVQPWGDRIGC